MLGTIRDIVNFFSEKRNLIPSIYVRGIGAGILLLFAITASALGVKDFTFLHLGTQDGLSSQRVYSLYKTKDNAVWWTTKYGVDRSNGAVVRNYPLGERGMYSSFAGRVVRFAHSICNDDETYVFDNTGCIYHYDIIQDRFDLVTNISKTLNIPVMLSDVLVTPECMWVAMREGVYQVMHKDGYKMKDIGFKYFSNYVLPYADGKLLFCSHNGVYDIILDGWNNIVVASYSGGIDVARPVGSTTAIFRHVMNNPQSIINDHVNCVANWNGDLLLMGTDDGISLYNMATEQWRHTSRGMVVLDVCKKSDGRLLIATYGNGVCELSADGQTRKLYSTADGTLKDDHVYRLSYDKAGNLWMGTLFGSLTVKTAEGNKYYDIDNILALTPLADGRMAIGSAHGLYLMSVNDAKPKMVEYMPEGKTDANRYVTDVFQNKDGKLWIATDGGGVYIYDLKTAKVLYQISSENGLPSNSVTSITRDQTGRIWFGTEKGLVFVKPEKPTDIVNVSYCYGLNTEYVQHAVANLPNGDIIYGTVDGAIIINPKNITRLNYQARLTIKGVRVHDDGQKAKEENQKAEDEFRQKIADGLKKGEIRLSYSERSFDVLFESINLRNHFDVAYQYKMEGMEWSPVITQQFLGFENLEPGKHILHIRSISRTSGIVLDERKVTIYIGQPWWNTWWMWCIYVLLIFLIFQGAWWMYNLHTKYLRLMREKVALPEESTLSPLPLENGEPTTAATPPSGGLGAEADSADEEEEAPSAGGEATEFVGMATKLTLDNLKDNDFTIDNLCREMGMSRTLFYVKLKTYTGKSPQDFVRTIRLERAATLLRQGRSVTEVSILTGFDNPKYFSTVFKKYFGVSPSKYE